MLGLPGPAVEPRFLVDKVPMFNSPPDDSILHATFWLILILVIGVASLMTLFVAFTRCARWCARSAPPKVDRAVQVPESVDAPQFPS